MIPVILGMNDPTGREVLSPRFGAGRRLRHLLPSLTLEEYVSGFERVNLLATRTWNDRRARTAARLLVPRLRGREVVVLGRRTWAALTPIDVPWFSSTGWQGATFHLVPHPSGRCLTYNDPEVRTAAGAILLGVYERGKRR